MREEDTCLFFFFFHLKLVHSLLYDRPASVLFLLFFPIKLSVPRPKLGRAWDVVRI